MAFSSSMVSAAVAEAVSAMWAGVPLGISVVGDDGEEDVAVLGDVKGCVCMSVRLGSAVGDDMATVTKAGGKTLMRRSLDEVVSMLLVLVSGNGDGNCGAEEQMGKERNI